MCELKTKPVTKEILSDEYYAIIDALHEAQKHFEQLPDEIVTKQMNVARFRNLLEKLPTPGYTEFHNAAIIVNYYDNR